MFLGRDEAVVILLERTVDDSGSETAATDGGLRLPAIPSLALGPLLAPVSLVLPPAGHTPVTYRIGPFVDVTTTAVYTGNITVGKPINAPRPKTKTTAGIDNIITLRSSARRSRPA